MAFENLLGKAADLLQTGVAKGKELTDVGVAKAKEVAEIGKLKVDNATELEAIKKAYLEMGKRYFELHGDAPDAEFAELCEKIAASKAKVEYNNERIADMKAAGEVTDVDVSDLEEAEVSVVEEAPAEEAPTAEEAPVAEDDTTEE